MNINEHSGLPSVYLIDITLELASLYLVTYGCQAIWPSVVVGHTQRPSLCKTANLFVSLGFWELKLCFTFPQKCQPQSLFLPNFHRNIGAKALLQCLTVIPGHGNSLTCLVSALSSVWEPVFPGATLAWGTHRLTVPPQTYQSLPSPEGVEAKVLHPIP